MLSAVSLRRTAFAALFTTIATAATAAPISRACYDIRAGSDLSKLTGDVPGARTLSNAQLKVLMIGATFEAQGDKCEGQKGRAGTSDWTFRPHADGSVDVDFSCEYSMGVYERTGREKWWVDDNQFCVETDPAKYRVPEPLEADFIAKDYRGTVIWDIKVIAHTEFSDRKQLLAALKEVRQAQASEPQLSQSDARR